MKGRIKRITRFEWSTRCSQRFPPYVTAEQIKEYNHIMWKLLVELEQDREKEKARNPKILDPNTVHHNTAWNPPRRKENRRTSHFSEDSYYYSYYYEEDLHEELELSTPLTATTVITPQADTGRNMFRTAVFTLK